MFGRLTDHGDPERHMRVSVGTSGYAYKEWKGHFYPADLKAQEFLRFYGSRFGSVEINNTFYRMPTEKLLLQWAAQVPDGFSFVLKASQKITHRKRLKECGEELQYFLRTANVLGAKLGPTLFQLPPNLKQDLPRLLDFLSLIPHTWRAAFEFRHASWFDETVYGALREHNAALVVAETDPDDSELAVPFVATAAFGYLRLRRAAYDAAALRAWAERVKSQAWGEAYVFFKHEDEATGPRLAAEFMTLVNAA
jgi:uncharacterized protein YecE (DUF72 family)